MTAFFTRLLLPEYLQGALVPMHPFELALSLPADDIEFSLTGIGEIPWLEFWLNPPPTARRRLSDAFPMRISFIKEDLFTIGGFVLDSYTTYRLQFEDIAPDDYHPQFLTEFGAAREKLRNAPGAQGRTGTGSEGAQDRRAALQGQ